MSNKRVLKFRAWHLDAELMRYSENNGGDFEFSPDASDHYLHEAIENPKISVMQFTGLLDYNGVEIYEGDIVEHKNGWTGVIVFNQEDCAFISENVRDRKDTAWLAPDIQAVIGNIHENPELLKP